MFRMENSHVCSMRFNSLTFIPMLRLISEGGMSPLTVRRESAGKVIAVEMFCAYIAKAFKELASFFSSYTKKTLL